MVASIVKGRLGEKKAGMTSRGDDRVTRHGDKESAADGRADADALACGAAVRAQRLEAILLFAGMVCLALTLPVFPPTYWTYVGITPLFEGTRFITTASLSTIVCAIALALRLLARPERQPAVGMPHVAACGTLYVFTLGMTLCVGIVVGKSAPLVSVVLGIAFGVGIFALLAAWTCALRCPTLERASYRSIALIVPLSVLVAVGLHTCVDLMPSRAHIVLVAVFSVAAGAIPALIVALGTKVCAGGGSVLSSCDGVTAERPNTTAVVHGDASVPQGALAQPRPTWLDLITPERDGGRDVTGVGSSSLGGGIMRRAAFYAGVPVTIFMMYFAASYSVMTLGLPQHFGDVWIIVACLLAMVPCALRRGSAIASFSFRAYLPIMGVVFLGVTTLMPDELELASASACALVLSFACGFMLLAVLLYLVSRRIRVLALPLTCLLAFLEAALMMMPYYKVHLLSLGSYIPTFLVCVLVASLGFFTLSPSLYGWRELFGIARATPPGVGLEQRMRDTCDEVARRFSLSPRESEILQYLGRGYGPSYLATILPIKENTIRSHVRNIYGKLSVNSRGELLELIDEVAREREGR